MESMELFRNNMVVNWHEHIWEKTPGIIDEFYFKILVDAAEATGQNHICCSTLSVENYHASSERIRCCNAVTLEAMRRATGLILGMCYINPEGTSDALYEIHRCIEDHGMIGVKLYHQYFIDDPAMYPIIETCIDLDVPILVHAGKLTHNPHEQPHISDGTHFANIGRRYPEANFIMAHIGGGGDWQWSLKAIQDVPNVVTDMSGSVCDLDIVEQTVNYLGASRILFGTDGSFSASIGKMLGANISLEDKKKILEGTNYLRFLKRGLH